MGEDEFYKKIDAAYEGLDELKAMVADPSLPGNYDSKAAQRDLKARIMSMPPDQARKYLQDQVLKSKKEHAKASTDAAEVITRIKKTLARLDKRQAVAETGLPKKFSFFGILIGAAITAGGFFLSPAITANAVAGLNSTTSSGIGALLLILGITGLFFFVRKK